MILFRKWLILSHRYLGIALSLLFVVWFASGIAMMYARGLPSLTEDVRLERLPQLDPASVRVSPAEALEYALWEGSPDRATLLTVMDRPAYRFGTNGGSVTVFADDGEILAEISEAEALAIASRFMDLPSDQFAYSGLLTEADQWTIDFRNQMPLHKIEVGDSDGTELYIPEYAGEVTLLTTRNGRMLAWIAAIPHWLYFAPLRLNDSLWRQVVLWTSGLGCVLALIGIVVGLLQFSPSRPFRFKRILSYVPYTGWMRWHYVTGVVFGMFTLTWVFSGMLSMEPWFWSTRGGLGPGVRQALSGGELDMALFPAIDAAGWERVLPGQAIKEIDFRLIQGDPYFLVIGASAKRALVQASPLRVSEHAFNTESLIDRVKGVYPDVGISESQLLSEYDSYYYPRGGSAPTLPVLRIKFDDPAKTWFYIDPGFGQLVGRYQQRQRLERWIYNGFHSLDFGFWYYNRPLWDISVIVLSAGGIGTSAIGLFLGFKRLGRNVKRKIRPGRSVSK